MSKAQAIRDIESGTHTYYVPWTTGRTEIRVVHDSTVSVGKDLRTDQDNTSRNNLGPSRRRREICDPRELLNRRVSAAEATANSLARHAVVPVWVIHLTHPNGAERPTDQELRREQRTVDSQPSEKSRAAPA